jgi:hypothetical protein
MESDQKEGGLRGRIEGESVKRRRRRRRLKVEHDRSDAVERRGKKDDYGRMGNAIQ